jgi:hypothetical protein
MRDARLGYPPIRSQLKRVITPELKGEEGDVPKICRVLSIKVPVYVDRLHM